MPKDLVPGGWVQEPCVFRQESAEVCGLCEQPFTLLNSSRHCAYCGHLFHRKHCSSRNGLGTHRACTHCADYRSHIRERLSEGEEFVCVSEGQEVCLSLCEETAELVLFWTAHNLKESTDLLQVELRKGFARCSLFSGEYEPLKSMSLVINNSKVLPLKSSSAWTCQLWVDGLKSTQYVYRCMLQQERTRLSYMDRGITVHPSWFTSYYLVPADPAPLIVMCTPNSTHELPPHTVTPLTPPTACTPSRAHHLADSGYTSDRLSFPRPWEVKVQCGRSLEQPNGLVLPIRHQASATHRHTFHSYPRHSPPHTAHSPHNLPYRHSPLSEWCRCHDYEIIPSRSVDVCRGGRGFPSHSPQCCGDCVDTCRIAQDLDNL